MSLDATMEAPEWSFGLQAEDAAQAFSGMPEAGARVNFDLTYRHLSVQAVTGTVTPRTAELGAEAGRLQLSAGQDGGAALELHAAAARVVAAGPGVPLGRLSMTAAESLLRLDLPQSSAAGTMPFDLVLRLARLMPGPEHLAPGSDAAALAGEGASADLALAGRLRGAADMPAPALEELRLDRLRVNFADAELSGSGAVTLGDGAPGAAPPEGGMTFTLDGGDALLQALHAAGLIADNQIMGLRMMMAMFTLPGETPDSAVVRLAFSPEGRLLLNGAPLN